MAIWILFILIFSPSSPAEEPFWRAKERVYQRIVEEREIIVSVTTQKISPEKIHRLRMQGGGQIDVPMEYAFRRAMELDSLVKMSDYVKSSQYDRKSQKLNLALEAYGHQASFEILVKPSEAEGRRSIDFTVLSGVLKNLKGRVEFRPVRESRAEVGFEARDEYENLPIPAMFLDFGLEFVLKRMAFSIRQKFEREFKAQAQEGTL